MLEMKYPAMYFRRVLFQLAAVQTKMQVQSDGKTVQNKSCPQSGQLCKFCVFLT